MSDNNIREERSVKEFNEWALGYDNSFWSFYFKSAYKKVLETSGRYINKKDKILDIGCGTGEFSSILSSKANMGNVIGLDISQKMIEVAKKKREGKNLQFILSRANSIPYENEYFDMVFCLNALHHIPNHNEFLKEVNRVLKKGGRFVLLDIVSNGRIRKTWISISKIIFQEEEVEFHTEEETNSLLKKAGFKNVTRQNFMFFTLLSVATKI